MMKLEELKPGMYVMYTGGYHRDAYSKKPPKKSEYPATIDLADEDIVTIKFVPKKPRGGTIIIPVKENEIRKMTKEEKGKLMAQML